MVKELPLHSELPVDQTWDLTPLYADSAAWEKDFKKIPAALRAFMKFKGHLADGPAVLRDAYIAGDKLGLLMERLHVYAHLKTDENTGDSENRGRADRLSAKSAEIDGQTAWFEPEQLAIPVNQFKEYLKAPDLKFYRRTLRDLDRDRKHMLSEPEERILGLASEAFSVPYKTFSVLNDADLIFPVIKNAKGEDERLTHGNYISFLESPDRRVRHDAFKACYSIYGQFKNSFAALLDGEVRAHVFESKLRKYRSALEASLSDDNIPRSVYDSLIAAVHKNIRPLYDYFAFRAKKLKLKKLDMFDIHSPLLPDSAMHFTWNEAVDLVRKALAPLGPEYAQVLNTAFRDRWMDIPECKGKRSGAYSSGFFRTPPYMLLNFNGSLDSVFTLAHEMGHSIHSWFSDRANEYHYASYKIFVAEVASTTNEVLLQKYMVAHTKDKKQKAYLLNHLIDTIRGTLFRQTMFAEFELMLHELAEKGEPLTADGLSDRYFELNKFYHGPAVNPDSDIRYEWARIPHFHYDFYVYQYATGISAALALSRKILNGETDGYFRFLKAGDSKDVIDIMKDAGVDFTSPAPVHSALQEFAELVKELKTCM